MSKGKDINLWIVARMPSEESESDIQDVS